MYVRVYVCMYVCMYVFIFQEYRLINFLKILKVLASYADRVSVHIMIANSNNRQTLEEGVQVFKRIHCKNWTSSLLWKYFGNIVEKGWKIQFR